MKKTFKYTFFLLAIAIAAAGCNSSLGAADTGDDESGSNPFYYYEGEKVPLKQIEDKIFIRSVSFDEYIDTDFWDKWNALVSSSTILQQSPDMKWIGGNFYWVVLQAKNGESIPAATIENFKANPIVGSVSYPFLIEHNGILQGLTNNFIVKLKETTSYEQLQQLTEENHCKIEKEDFYVKNLFFVNVPKTSALNAMQMSDLFYETDLFESVQPTFVILNISNLSCEDKRVIKVLEEEPAYIRKGCFEHLRGVDAFVFELVNIHNDLYSQGRALFPLGDIPEQYRKEGMSVYISGNVVNCAIGGCSEPNIRISPINAFELKSIKINNK